MRIPVAIQEKWDAVREKFRPVTEKIKGWREKIRPVTERIGKVFSITGKVLYRLRKVFLAIPVVYYAVRLANYNMEKLPEMVGFNLQSTGEFAEMVSRETAVYGPLGITAVCLLLMFCSRRAVYPWVISIFSLALPLLILLTNVYPA